MLGESAYLLLEGQKVTPKKLLERNFHFKFPKSEMAIEELLKHT